MPREYSKTKVAAITRDLRAVKAHYGKLTKINIVQWAKDNRDSRLAQEFNWNIREAAESWWLHQAGQVVQCCKVRVFSTGEETDTEPRLVRVYASIPKEEGNEYEELDVVLANKVDRATLLDQMRRDADAMRRRYESHQELSNSKSIKALHRMIAAIDAEVEVEV